MSTRCEFTDLPTAERDHCRPKPDRAGELIVTSHGLRGWREARFAGRCAGCGEPIDEGDLIRHDPDADGWIAECCDQPARQE